MMSHLQYMIVYVSAGVIGVILFALVFILILRLKKRNSSPKYPSIVLTSHDSPQFKQKRLWSPPENSKPPEKKKSMAKSERKEIRSYWFPKRGIEQFLPPIKGEYLQPSHSKHHGDIIKGRLKFSFGYDYNMELQKSILTVRLHHGRDYTQAVPDNLPMDTFVKTRLIPSSRQTYTSKLRRRTLNPNYNECYHFDITYSELNSQVLCFEVFRYNCLSSPEIFGEVVMPFKDIGTHGCDVIKEVSMSMNIVDCVAVDDSDTSSQENSEHVGNNNKYELENQEEEDEDEIGDDEYDCNYEGW